MVREAVQQSGGELLVAAEDLRPLGERQVRRDEYAATLVALCDGVEEQLAAGAVERDEADLVDDEQVDAIETSLCAAEFARVARFDESAHEIGCTSEGNASTLARGLDAEAIARCVLPVPIGPARITFSARSSQPPRASSEI